MTIVYTERVDSEEHTRVLQWGISLLLVVVLHFSVALWLLSRDTAVKPNKTPPAAYLDLPPLPLPGAGGPPGTSVPKPAQTKPPVNLPPTPPAAPKPVAPPVPLPQPNPQPAPASVPKIVVPPAAAPQAVLPKTPAAKPPKPQTLKPPPPTPQAPAAAADQNPLAGSAPIVRLSARGAWQASVIAQITSLKKWPPRAVQMKLTGSVVIFIRIDRLGNILEYGIRRSSGYALLDRATLDMARRAVKLAPLPAEIPGEDYGFDLSIDWF